MPDFLKLITLGAFVAMGSSALAQDTATPKPEGETATPTAEAAPAAETPAQEDGQATNDPLPLDMGQEVTEERGPGTTYVKDRFEAWELRCVRVEDGQKEPCHLFQLMQDDKGVPIAEMNIIALPKGQQAAAGATIVTPLETLLTKQLTLEVDGGAKKRYPFTWCGNVGCYSRVGFTNGDIAAFKRGAKATLTIVPVFAPDETISVTLSLAGFTAGYKALQETLK
ncbi:invasion associated locus B family protein [Profundibacter sp.]